MKKNKLVIIFSFLFFVSCKMSISPVTLSKESINFKGRDYIMKGFIWYNRGCYTQSLKNFLKAHEVFSAEDNRAGVAMSLNNIGITYKMLKDSNRAAAYFEEAFKIYSDIKRYKDSIEVLQNIASLAIELQQLDNALDLVEQAELIIKSKNIEYPTVMITKGIIFTKQKKYTEADILLKKAALKISKHDYKSRASLNFAIAKLMFETNRYDDAINYFTESLDLDKRLNFYSGMAEDILMIGKIKLAQNKTDEAISYFKRSIKIYAIIHHIEKTEEIMPLLENIAKVNKYNIDITKNFIMKWTNNEMLENRCR